MKIYLILIASIFFSYKGTAQTNEHLFDNKPLTLEAISAAAKESQVPEKGLEEMDKWIEYINSSVTDQNENERNELLSLCYRYKADAYQILKKYESALENYEKAIELDTNNINAHFNLGVLYSDKMNKRDRALEKFDMIIEKKPDFADAHFARGKINENMGNYVNAVINYAKAIELDGTKEAYKDNKTVMYMHLHQSKNAIAEASRLIELFPNDEEAYKLRANSYFMAMQYNKALDDYSKLVYLNPKPAYYSLRANCLEALQRYEEALQDYDNAMNKQKDNGALMYSSRGRVFEKLGQYEKALTDHDQALSMSPDHPVVFAYRGHTYLTIKEYEKAIEDYSIAIECYPSSEYYRFRGNAYRDSGQYEEAFNDYNKGIEECSDMWKFYKASLLFERGIAYFNSKDYKNAMDDFSKALKADPEDRENLVSSINEYIEKIKSVK